ncbi:replication initiation negative regulator SeqA, partial [Enterobacter asburiae]
MLSDESPEKKKRVTRFMVVIYTVYSLKKNGFAEGTDSSHGR